MYFKVVKDHFSSSTSAAINGQALYFLTDSIPASREGRGFAGVRCGSRLPYEWRREGCVPENARRE